MAQTKVQNIKTTKNKIVDSTVLRFEKTNDRKEDTRNELRKNNRMKLKCKSSLKPLMQQQNTGPPNII